MTSPEKQEKTKQPKPIKSSSKQERLAAALRKNIKRRIDVSRRKKEAAPSTTPLKNE